MMNESPQTNDEAQPAFYIHQGYRTGLIGKIVTLHAETYEQWAGFDLTFEAKVASELAAFVQRLDRPVNRIWWAETKDRVIGSIAIDGEDLGDGKAHLRWFIVDPTCRGAGIGKQLLDQALDFVDRQSFSQTQLWTLKGLKAARHLYEHSGFRLEEDYLGDQWGKPIIEQMFVRSIDLKR